jgi:hypothetical protein
LPPPSSPPSSRRSPATCPDHRRRRTPPDLTLSRADVRTIIQGYDEIIAANANEVLVATMHGYWA